MSYIQLFISLKIPDNVARTALYSVRTRLGYSSMQELRRSDFWELYFPQLDSARAMEVAERLVLKTSYFMNPNKHRWHKTESDVSVSTAPQVRSPYPADVSLFVQDRTDGKAESTLSALHPILDPAERPAALSSGVWWDLSFAGLSPDEIHHAAEDLAVTRSRTEGLFANPHYQTCKLFYPGNENR